METKRRGRKAIAGTYEARDYVNKGLLSRLLVDEKELTDVGAYRIEKAVKFGLGITETE